jgi:hypothetical protein
MSRSMNISAKLWVKLSYVINVSILIIRVGDVNYQARITLFVYHRRVLKSSRPSDSNAAFVHNTTLITSIKVHYNNYMFAFIVLLRKFFNLSRSEVKGQQYAISYLVQQNTKAVNAKIRGDNLPQQRKKIIFCLRVGARAQLCADD